MHNFSERKVVGTVTVLMNVTEEDIEAIVVGSFEGGSTYWMGVDNATPEWDDKPKDEPLATWATKLLLEGKTVRLYDAEDHGMGELKLFELTLEKLLKGIEQNAKYRPWDFDIADGDADTYDCIMQYALFGEVVHG